MLSKEPDFQEKFLNSVKKKIRVEKKNGSVVAHPDFFVSEYYEYLCESRLSDGLPVIPPTPERVKAMLRYCDRDPDTIITNLAPLNSPLPYEKLAANAVMAGCAPQYFPVLISAFECMSEPKYNISGAAVTTNMAANMILVSGPIAEEIGINGGMGCFGPGWRPNATIGRAVNLCLVNVGGAIPGESCRSTFQTPARYSFCFSENSNDYPKTWDKVNSEHFDSETTSVSCMVCEGPRCARDSGSNNVKDLMETIAASATNIGANNVLIPSGLGVIIGPGHAEIISKAGWSKDDVRYYLFDHARNPRTAVESRGGEIYSTYVKNRSPWVDLAFGDRVPCVRTPDDIIVAVAGGRPGYFTQIVQPWIGSHYVTKPVTLKDGSKAKSINDFLR
jgi:hypothetical protein